MTQKNFAGAKPFTAARHGAACWTVKYRHRIVTHCKDFFLIREQLNSFAIIVPDEPTESLPNTTVERLFTEWRCRRSSRWTMNRNGRAAQGRGRDRCGTGLLTSPSR